MIPYFIFELGCLNSEKSVKMRSKQLAYTREKQGRKVVLERASWRQWNWSLLFAAFLVPNL